MLIQNTIERIFIDKKFGDLDRGMFLVRGDNLALLGEVTDADVGLVKYPIEEILKEQARIEQLTKQLNASIKFDITEFD